MRAPRGALAARGVTVFVSPHFLSDVEAPRTQRAARHCGRMLVVGPILSLLARGRRFRAEVDSAESAAFALSNERS